jgi:hypothetical protein
MTFMYSVSKLCKNSWLSKRPSENPRTRTDLVNLWTSLAFFRGRLSWTVIFPLWDLEDVAIVSIVRQRGLSHKKDHV